MRSQKRNGHIRQLLSAVVRGLPRESVDTTLVGVGVVVVRGRSASVAVSFESGSNWIRPLIEEFSEGAADDYPGNPSSRCYSFAIPWKDVHQIYSLESATQQLREARSPLQWRFAGERDRVYLVSENQTDEYMRIVLPRLLERIREIVSIG